MPDPDQEFTLETDASDISLVAALRQVGKPIGYEMALKRIME